MTQGQRLVITATLITAAALASSTIMLTHGDPCGNHPVAVIPAPSGRQKAVIFDRGCGSSSPRMGRMVSLLPSDAKFPPDGEVGNAFRIDNGGSGTAPIDVAASWESDSVLVIRHRADANVSFAVLRDRGVRIRYETLP